MITISQEAKDALVKALKENYPYDLEITYRMWYDDAIIAIESFPASDGWIPVTERFPEDLSEVLAYDGSLEDVWMCWYDRWIFEMIATTMVIKNVSHWKPIYPPVTK